MNKKGVRIILIVLLICVIGVFSYYKFLKKEPEVNTVKVMDSIDDFNYTLDERDTKLMKSIYKELKETLKNETVDYKEYASLIARLFIVDLFTLNNKINKYDVGGYEYVYPSSVDNFKLNVESTIYKYLEDNTYETRKQELPEVSEIEVLETVNDTYTIDNVDYDSYIISLKWDYKKNMNYENKAIITLVKKDNKVFVVEYKPGE